MTRLEESMAIVIKALYASNFGSLAECKEAAQAIVTEAKKECAEICDHVSERMNIIAQQDSAQYETWYKSRGSAARDIANKIRATLKEPATGEGL